MATGRDTLFQDPFPEQLTPEERRRAQETAQAGNAAIRLGSGSSQGIPGLGAAAFDPSNRLRSLPGFFEEGRGDKLGRQLRDLSPEQISQLIRIGAPTAENPKGGIVGRQFVTLPTGETVAVNPKEGSLLFDTRQLAGEAELARQQDPTQQRFGAQALDALGRIDLDFAAARAGDVDAINRLLARQQQNALSQAQGTRGIQQGALGQLQRLASGEDSVVAAQERLARDRLQQGIAGQLASQRGRFNPAAQRQAFRALSEGLTGLGAQTAAAAAEERRGALAALLGGSGQARGQDLAAAQLPGVLAGQRAGLTGLASSLEGMSNAQRAAFFDLISGKGDRAAQEALQAAGITAGVPVQPEQRSNPFANIGGGIGTGAAIGGAFGGPVGAAVGGAVGGAATGIKELIDSLT